MAISEDWFSVPSENEEGQTIIATVREKLEKFARSGKFNDLVEITWRYDSDSIGMPQDAEAKQMEEMENALRKAMEGDNFALLAIIYIGGGEKVWEFYSRSAEKFGKRLNEALASFSLFPITIATASDKNWDEYFDACELKAWAVD